MDKIKYSKKVLLKTLEENKQNHIHNYEVAWAVFAKEYREKLQEMVDKTKSIPVGCAPIMRVNLAIPQSNEDDYDRAIRMIELSSQDEFDLDEQEVRRYLMDDWSWSAAFASNTLSYSNKNPF